MTVTCGLPGGPKILSSVGVIILDPAVIEEALMRHQAVAFVGAIGQPDSHAGEVPCAYVETN